MELALYDPELGYYARAAQRSGRAGDFFTSVDIGPLFGELLEVQIEEMFRLLAAESGLGAELARPFDLVEAGAGNARLSTDILRAATREHPDFYARIRLHLVEASAAARGAQRAMLAEVADRLISSESSLPASFEGMLVANELLDALPVHQVVMRTDGLREIYVSHQSSVIDPQSPVISLQSAVGDQQSSRPTTDDARPTTDDWRLTTVEGPPSTPALAEYLDRIAARLEPGWRVEVNLRAVEWIRDAARRLRRGFIIVIDYGHEARELYSASHSAGTLTTFYGHHSAGSELRPDAPAWMQSAGGQDITAHVDFTSVRRAAEAEGLTTLGFLDQTYFLLGLLQSDDRLRRTFLHARETSARGSSEREGTSEASGGGTPRALKNAGSSASGSLEPLRGANAPSSSVENGIPAAMQQSTARADLKQNAALRTLLMPGGLGSSHKVLILGKNVGTPSLKGCSYRIRVT